MTATTNGTTARATSVRAGSLARALAKRRDKPYKTEQNRVFAKKRKLDLHTTYSDAPAGFTLLKVGTPELAGRCKELSRQRGLPVYVVNAKPVSRHAIDPEKVSHHIHRVGYHFRSEVVEDACQELGYIHHNNQFVKEADLRAREEHTRMARAMAKYGLHLDQAEQQQETDDQVRAAIKELFPRIPEADLQAILKHAWEEGTGRVGNNADLTLPRRVQLATIARIRHEYTDYDRLLRAFEWKDARAEVEPVCLQKLIEWRGETEDNDDNELEEIVRETIVIDDDDEAAATNGSEADDEDSVMAMENGYNSDTSIEISHKLAGDEDLGAESHDERSQRFLQRWHAPPRNVQQRRLDVRQKIGAVREQMRNGIAPSTQQYADFSKQAAQSDQFSRVIQVNLLENGRDIIEINGQRFLRAPVPPASHHPSPQQFAALPAQPRSPYVLQQQQDGRPISVQKYQRHTDSAGGYALHDRPVASIEPHDNLRRAAIASASAFGPGARQHGNRSRPVTPNSDGSDKRRPVETTAPAAMTEGSRVPRFSPPTSVAAQVPDVYARPRKSIEGPVQGVPRCYGQSMRPQGLYAQPQAVYIGRPQGQHPPQNAAHHDSHRRPPPNSEPYDPLQPLIRADDRRDYYAGRDPGYDQQPKPAIVDAQVAPIQYIPHPWQNGGQYQHPARSLTYDPQRPNSRYQAAQRPRVVYIQAPSPVHGAPAAIQQVPRGSVQANECPAVYQLPATAADQPPPVGQAPQTPQTPYHYSR
ncbi:hypothetical protein DOTSEDRAFT_49180 [Dothistroma septosporum NZE10]|uniref:DUF2293 domain-containing protein n=1 Tax=Dothistroma septosporum (strain NZE10 / CBS 128990) TaxID=675120 RepID=N1Q2S3_DOTSN|nr:hypothetical protein DOTSEDRAFT_49180 [Dothistroma septosporum NZE10]